jgi:isopenicillin-N epimerase
MIFGRAMLEHWLLDPEHIYLNHGTVGATPRRVLDRQQHLRDEAERHPSRFMLRELSGEMPTPWRGSVRNFVCEASHHTVGLMNRPS